MERCDAFISYRRADGTRAANWLRNRLQTYRPPKGLRRRQRSLEIYLDRSYETAASDFYKDNTLPALKAAERLIVIATPATLEPGLDGDRNWVEREIADYPDENRIIVAIGVEMPDSRLPGGLDRTFPLIERVDLRGAGATRPWAFAARARLHEEFLKIAAPLWGIASAEMPLLRREEARRQMRRIVVGLAAAVTLLVILSALLVWGMINLASARRQLAANHLVQGQELVDTKPAEARLHFVRAIEIAEGSRLPWLRLPQESRAARAWLGVHYRDEPTMILRHPDVVQWVRFDGSGTAATAGNDGVIRLWRDGQLVRESPRLGAPVMWVAFDKSGGRVAFAADLPKQRIGVWEWRTNRVTEVIEGQLQRPQYGPGNDDVIAIEDTAGRLRVWAVDSGFRGPPIEVQLNRRLFFSPRAELAAVSGDGTLSLWEIRTGRKIAELPYAPVGVAFSADGRRVCVPISERTLQVFDAKTGQPAGAAITVPRLLSAPALDENGSRAVVVWHADDNVSPMRHLQWISIRSVASGEYLVPPQQVEGLTHPPRFLGRDTVMTVNGSEVRLWNAVSGLVIARQSTGERIVDVAVDARLATFAASTTDGSVHVLDLESLTPQRAPIEHTGNILWGLRLSDDGMLVASHGDDKTVRIARARRANTLKVLRPATSLESFVAENAITDAAIRRDGQVVAAANGRGVDLWIDGALPKHILDCAATTVAFASGGSLAAGCRDRGVWLFDQDGSNPRQLIAAPAVRCIAFTPDGRELLTCSAGNAQLWDLTTGKPAIPEMTHPSGVRNAVVSPDGRWIATVGNDDMTIIRDACTGTARSPKLGTYGAFDLAFSPDGKMLATSGPAVRVWKVPSGQLVTAELSNPNGYRTVAFSPDGTRLLTGGLSGESQMWDLRASRPDGVALIDQGAVWDSAFSADGSRIVTGTNEHGVALWDSRSKRRMLPTLPVEGSALVAHFDAPGNRVLIGTSFGGLFLWDVRPATGTPAALRLAAERDSGRTIDESSGLVRAIR